VAGECCFDRLTQVFGMGLYSDRQYDFLSPSGSTPGAELAPERIAEAVAAYTKAISDTDQLLADVARRAGGVCVSNIVTQNHPWKSDDKLWFEQHPERAHRTRSPFPGEIDEAAIKTSAERALVMLIRQVEPGARLRAVVDIIIDLLPLPDDEATLHALFEAGMGREAVPRDREALRALAEKYTAPRESSQ